MAGLYQIRLQWERISKELKLGRTKKDIYENLKKEGLFTNRYENFLLILKKELKERDRITPEPPPSEEILKVSEPSQILPSIESSKGSGIFSKRDVAKDMAEIQDAENKFLTK